MAYRFYYIDDDPLEIIKGISRVLSINKDLLEVIPFQHSSWVEIKSYLLENQNDFSGLIFDWKLKNKNESGVFADFNVAALAQQLRILSVEKKDLKKDFPIILCSAESDFYKVYKKEKTIHDLFDFVYSKDDISESYPQIIKQICSLSSAYESISISESFSDLQMEEDILDIRFIEGVISLYNEGKIAHLITKYFLNNLVLENGLLIDEYLLASRLGVDVFVGDLDSWETVKFDILDCIRYKGLLSDGWTRWSNNGLLKFWLESFGVPLSSLDGAERVQLLNSKFSLNLSTAVPLRYNKSSYFWYVCDELKRPISFDEAILAKKETNVAPWLDNRYYSYEESFKLDLNRDIDLIDRDKVLFLKKRFAHENIRTST